MFNECVLEEWVGQPCPECGREVSESEITFYRWGAHIKCPCGEWATDIEPYEQPVGLPRSASYA